MEEYSQPFDICIVCALAEEANAVVHEFSDRYENIQFQQAFSQKNRYAYRHAMLKNSKGESLTVLVICLPFTGPIETVLSVRSLLEEFHPRFVAMTGICAGYQDKVALGDLVAASYAFHYEEGKVEAGEQGQDTLRPEWRTHGPTKRIVQYLHAFTKWEPLLAEMKQRLLGRALQLAERPRCLIAPIASGMAVQGNNPFPRLLEHNRKAVFLDQEVAALYQTLQEFPDLSFLAVKGVCDFANPHKNDDYHEYAARASAAYLLIFIQEYVTEESMPRRDAPFPSDRAGPSGTWNVPYRHNPFFTGRENLLSRLYTQLQAGQATALSQPQAISGLGGIGKTQIAIEYACRHREDYQAILWVRADTRESLVSGYSTIATLLNLPQKDEQDQTIVLKAVMQWLTTRAHWLLILDNADDLALLREFFPSTFGGHILLTTRASAMGQLAQRIEVDTMDTNVGTVFLLRRAGVLASDASLEAASPSDVIVAKKITEELGGLPLALDQAGAYIEETQCGLSGYHQRYQARRARLLKRRGGLVADHPEPVATTWSLSFEKVEQANPATADLLRLCAYLSPDAIPEEIVTKGAVHLGPLLEPIASDAAQLDEAIAALGAYSLVRRNAKENTLSLHRLVQAVLKDQMDERSRQQWAERTVRAVDAALPEVEHGTWPQWERMLAHALACSELIEQQSFHFADATHLLHLTGRYLMERTRYKEAEPLLERALQISEQEQGIEHPEATRDASALAVLHKVQGKYALAEPLYVRALAICEQWLGADHPHTLTVRRNYVALLQQMGRDAEAT